MNEFTREDILNDPIFEKFLKKKKGIKKSTKCSYIYAWLGFCRFTGKSVTQIHDLHKKDFREGVPDCDKWLPDTLDNYVTYMSEDLGLSYQTIQLYLTGVLGFFKKFRLTPIPEIEIEKKQVTEPKRYRLTVEDIQKAIRNSQPTYQTIFTVQAQTGLAIGDVVSLNVEDFIKAIKYSDKSPIYWPVEEEYTAHDLKNAIEIAKENKDMVGCFDWTRKKTGNEFYTFIGPEALRSIAILLESRTIELEQESPIFLKDTSRLPNLTSDWRLTPGAAVSYVKRMHRDRGIFPQITVDGKLKNYFRTHKIRAWYAGKVRFEAKLGHEDTKYLMGQTTGDVLEKYIDPNTYKNLKENYFLALPYLAIFEPLEVHTLTGEDKAELERMKERETKREEETQQQKEDIDYIKSVLVNNPYLEILKDPGAREALEKYRQNKAGR